MPRLRPALLALVVVPAVVHATDFDAAMRCVYAGMTGALVPATSSAEQIASVVLARCSDEIEMAAVALAGMPLAHDRLDRSRIAVRRDLLNYAMAVAAGPASAGAEPVATRARGW